VSAADAYRLEGVTQRYGDRQALRVDRLEVPRGEVLCLLGPTGAGKSTLQRLLAGVDAPASGMVLFGDGRLAGRDTAIDVLRRVTLVFQRPLLLGGTARANVEYGLRLRGRAPDGPVVRRVLEALALDGLADRPAHTLSGGEAQLTALARALVLGTEALLLDEPTAGLDPARVARAEAAVAAANQAGTTVVWATHNLFQARRVGHRAALLLDGRLVEVGPVPDFFDNPRDPRTAAFVRGEMVY
jgi:tungstate transport system ATP-binding protein